MVSMVNFSSDNIDNTNAAYCRQMTNAMEMLVKQAKHQAYRFILDDNGITGLVTQMRTKRSTVRELMSLLTKTLQNDPYYESVYLYSEEDKLLMTTTHWGGTSLYEEADFSDQEIIAACQKRKSGKPFFLYVYT